MKVIINSIVEIILAVVNPEPILVVSIVTKQVKAARLAGKIPSALYKLFPKAK